MRHVLKGAGFGHGIGMSQYGAYGYALEGSGYKTILGHYYEGTRLESAPGRPVRVLLQPSDPYIRFRGATSANGEALSKGTTYVARRSGSGIVLRTSGGRRVGRASRNTERECRRHRARCGCSAPRSTRSATASTAAQSRSA